MPLTARRGTRKGARPVGESVGRRITTLRTERELTLEGLAAGTGLTSSFLSRLERGHTSISVDNLRQIASFFGVEMVHFFEAERPSQVIVTKRGKGTHLLIDHTTAFGESLITTTRSSLQATLYRTPVHQGREHGFAHDGDEFVYVLRGMLEYRAGDTQVLLRPGDSVWHKSTEPHSWRNAGSETAVSLHVNTPPVW